MINDYFTINIHEYLISDELRTVLNKLLASFDCSEKNEEVDGFLKGSAVTFAEKGQSATYLVFADENNPRLLAKDKEVQIMMLAEKYAMADIATMKEQERTEGRAEGRAEGENIMLYKLVHDGSLKISIAAKKAGIKVKQFEANMIAAGYSLP